MKLLYFNQHHALTNDALVRPDVLLFSKFFKLYGDGTIAFLDRTGLIKTPIAMHSVFPMPQLRAQPKSFEDICNERARQLLDLTHNSNRNLYVFWSGGIDSTLVLVSLLKQATSEEKKKIIVLMTENSIEEYPLFFEKHIIGTLQVSATTMFPHILGTDNIIVGGEGNDQLFGSDVMAKLILSYTESFIHAPYQREKFFTYFDSILSEPKVTNFYLDQFERLAAHAPMPIKSNLDFVWWINFSCKWQSVFMRMLTFTTPRYLNNITKDYVHGPYQHFFFTDDFQLWSMNNLDKRIRETWNTYKWVCKDIIYEYTKDAEYRKNKLKKGSLSSLLTLRSPYNFMDDEYRMSHTLPFESYYAPHNDFLI
ncbi:hypothetical protein EBR66_04915 [bacterium]|nr:hypothetical protein [bacterium]